MTQQQVAFLLQTTYTAVDREERRQAEAALEQYQVNPVEYFNLLAEICVSMDYTLPVRSSAANYMKIFVRSLISGASTLQPADELSLAIRVLDLLKVLENKKEVLSTLKLVLTVLLCDRGYEATEMYVQNIFPQFIQTFSGQISDIRAGLIGMQLVFTGMSYKDHAVNFLQQSWVPFLNAGKQTLGSLMTAIESGQQSEISKMCLMIEEWGATLVAVLDHLELTMNPTLSQLARDEGLLQILSGIVLTMLPDEMGYASVINFGETQDYYGCLNKAKTSALYSLQQLLAMLAMAKRRPSEGCPDYISTLGVELPASPLVNQSYEIAEKCTNSLYMIWQNPDLETLLDYRHVQELIVQMILYLRWLACEVNFHQMFLFAHKSIIVDICLVLLRITETERDTFAVSPDEFVQFSTDICERQSSEVPKTCAAQLLEDICEHVDGALTFTGFFLLQSLEMTLSQKEIGDFPYLASFYEHSVFLACNEEERIETSLMALSVVSSLLGNREDLLDMLEIQMIQYSQQYFTSQSPIVQSRVCMLFYFYSDRLFDNKPVALQEYLTFLITCLDPESVETGVIVQSCETLQHLTREEGMMEKMEPFVPIILEKMADVFLGQMTKTFFEIFHEIVYHHTESIQPVLLEKLMQVISTKINLEVGMIVQKQKGNSDTIRIIKCWNILRVLADSQAIIPLYRGGFETYLEFLFANRQNQVNYNDEFIQVLASIVKKSPDLSAFEISIIYKLLDLQKTQPGPLGAMFPLLTALLSTGQQQISETTKLIKPIITCAVIGLTVVSKGHKESAVSEAALILHQALITFKGLMPDLIPYIVSLVVRRLSEPVENEFLKVRMLDVIFAAWFNDAEATNNVLSAVYPDLTILLKQIVEAIEIFTHQYDKKIAILGLWELITSNALPAVLAAQVTDLFVLLVKILKAKKADTAEITSKHKTGEVLTQDIVQDDMAILGEAFMRTGLVVNDSSREEKNANAAIGQIQGMLLTLDEFEYFRQVMQTIRNRSSDAFALLINSLPPMDQQFLIEILQTQKVVTNRQVKILTVDRKIIKPKHLI